MKTKSTFTINFDSITNSMQHIFDSLQDSKVNILSKKGKSYVKMPLLLAIVVGIIFPVAIVVTLILTMLSFISIVIERESQEAPVEIKYLENK